MITVAFGRRCIPPGTALLLGHKSRNLLPRRALHWPGTASISTTFGALPLLLGSGAGAESRQPIGLVIVSGVVVSAVLTLFVVPALYSVLARNTKAPQHVARAIAKLRSADTVQQPAG